jgi:hypothetical protein
MNADIRRQESSNRAKDNASGTLSPTAHHRDRSPESNLRKSAVISFPRFLAFLVPSCDYLVFSVLPLRLCDFA